MNILLTIIILTTIITECIKECISDRNAKNLMKDMMLKGKDDNVDSKEKILGLLNEIQDCGIKRGTGVDKRWGKYVSSSSVDNEIITEYLIKHGVGVAIEEDTHENS